MQIASNVIKRLRWNKGWTQEELSIHARVSENTIRKMEAGGYNPRPSTAKKVADTLGVQVEDIIIGNEGLVLGAVGQAAVDG